MTLAFTRVVLVATLLAGAQARAADPFWASDRSSTAHAITVYRAASCGCCKGWVSHLRDHRFVVEEIVMDDLSAVKRTLGVAPELASCHTAIAGDHVFEGHVPANDIKAVIEGDTDVRLLAVPAMPSGSPGMDFPGARKDDFTVVAEKRNGERSAYRSYSGY